MEFFRKYQKYFFFLIAVVVISSFAFFGTFSTFHDLPTREDQVIGQAIDGSDMKLIEMSNLARFIAADREDVFNHSRQVLPNFFNDGVIRKDLLGTGIAEILVRENFEPLKQELESRVRRIKAYQSYEHPDAPFLSAKAIWQRFAPELNREWSFVQSLEEVDADVFGHLARLYHFNQALPSEWLRQVLMMHEQQYKQWLRPDPKLRQEDLTLFGFHSLADWFGKDFVDLAAQFIHNAAIEAQSKGFRVSKAEVKADLLKSFHASMQKMQSSKMPVEMTYKDQLLRLGISEAEAISAWGKVLLFRRYFADRGNSMFLDKLPYVEFSSIAKEQASVDVYQWAPELNMTSALDLLTLQTYLKAVAPQDPKDPLSLPTETYSLQEIEKTAPELVATLYKANVFAIDKREAALKASLKELWAFETQEEIWKQLNRQFSYLQNLPAADEEERFCSLETLDPVQRGNVDLFARRLLVDRHPEWIDESLQIATAEEKELVLSAGKIELPHVTNPERLGWLFQHILSSPEEVLSELSRFESGEAVFRFENIEKITDPKIKTFREAVQDGSLRRMVDRILRAEFPKIRMKLSPDQAVKELSDVQEEVASILLGNLKQKIEHATADMEEDAHFAPRRLAAIALRARESLQAGGSDPCWIRTEGEDPIIAQFKLQRVEKQITRTAEEAWMSKEPFVLIAHQWSPVHIDPDGGVLFIYLKDRKTVQEPVLDRLSVGKEMLSSDVQRLLAEKLLATMRNKHSVVIPLQPEQE